MNPLEKLQVVDLLDLFLLSFSPCLVEMSDCSRRYRLLVHLEREC